MRPLRARTSIRALRLLTRDERRLAAVLALLIAVAEAVLFVALLAVLPVVGLLIEPGLIETSRWLRLLHESLGAPPPESFIIGLSVGAAVLIVVGQVASFLTQVALERYTVRIQTRLAAETMAACIGAPYPWFLDRNAAAIVRVFQSDFAIWAREFVGSLLRVLTNLLTLTLGGVIVVAAAPVGGIAALAAVGLLAYGIAALLRPQMLRWTRLKPKAAERLMVVTTQTVSGIKDVAAAGAQGFFLDLFRRLYEHYADITGRARIAGQLPNAILTPLAQIGLLLILLIFWMFGSRGGELASQMTLVMLVTSRVVPAVNRLATLVTGLFDALPWIAELVELRDSVRRAHDEQAHRPGGQAPQSDWAAIRLVEVGFSYRRDAAPVLAGLTAELRRGLCYGVIGPSGAGKSTFVDLLLGFLQPTGGRVEVGTAPLETLDLNAWRRRIGYVSQAPYLLDDDIRANVAFGVPLDAVDDHRVRSCLRMAGLDDFVAALPEGIETRLGDRGTRLSGGQRQRIAIARALYREPDLLVLDEATAALDHATEARILDTLQSLKRRVTILIISHRMSTVAICDEVMYLEGGRVARSGPFSSLVAELGWNDASTTEPAPAA